MKKFLLVLFVFYLNCFVFGVIANPDPFFISQKNGKKIKVVRCGNKWNNWLETLDGYPITRNPEGWWVYARASDSVGVEFKVGIDIPNGNGLPLKQNPPAMREVPASAGFAFSEIINSPRPQPVYKILIILVEFSNSNPGSQIC